MDQETLNKFVDLLARLLAKRWLEETASMDEAGHAPEGDQRVDDRRNGERQ